MKFYSSKNLSKVSHWKSIKTDPLDVLKKNWILNYLQRINLSVLRLKFSNYIIFIFLKRIYGKNLCVSGLFVWKHSFLIFYVKIVKDCLFIFSIEASWKNKNSRYSRSLNSSILKFKFYEILERTRKKPLRFKVTMLYTIVHCVIHNNTM